MQRRSQSLQTRLDDIKTRLRTMRTVTNTASAEISGGETIVDEDGSIYFMDEGKLRLGSSAIETADGRSIIDSSGNLTVDSLVVYGDVLSARDYEYQREAVEVEPIHESLPTSVSKEFELEFPDWSSSALVTFYIHIKTRFSTPEINPVLVSINGKPVARPRTDFQGDVVLDSSVVRRVTPEAPVLRVDVVFDEEPTPSSGPTLVIDIGGVYSV